MKSKYIVFLILLLASACTKETLPELEEASPVFMVKTADGTLDITAGRNDFYQYSSFRQDDLEVYSFVSQLAKLTPCNICNEALLIEVRDIQTVESTNGINIEESVRAGTLDFFNTSDSSGTSFVQSYSVDLQANMIAGATYEWDFGDGTMGTGALANKVFSGQLSATEVCLTTTVAGCSTIDCNTVTFTQTGASLCQADIAIVSQDLIQDSMEWEIVFEVTSNDNLTSISWGDTVTTRVFDISAIPDPICVEVLTDNNCMDMVCKNLIFNNNGASLCTSGFSLGQVQVLVDTFNDPDPFQFNRVKIAYTTPDGITYRTMPQVVLGTDSFFRITKVEDYEDNENGEKTKKLDVEFTCTLYDEDGNPLRLEEAKGTIAIAYPS